MSPPLTDPLGPDRHRPMRGSQRGKLSSHLARAPYLALQHNIPTPTSSSSLVRTSRPPRSLAIALLAKTPACPLHAHRNLGSPGPRPAIRYTTIGCVTSWSPCGFLYGPHGALIPGTPSASARPPCHRTWATSPSAASRTVTLPPPTSCSNASPPTPSRPP